MNDNGLDTAWQETPSEPFLGTCDSSICDCIYITKLYNNIRCDYSCDSICNTMVTRQMKKNLLKKTFKDCE